MKEVEDTSKQKDTLCWWAGRINIVKTFIPLYKAIYRFNAIPIKISIAFFTEIFKNPKIWNHKRIQIAKSGLFKKHILKFLFLILERGEEREKEKGGTAM